MWQISYPPANDASLGSYLQPNLQGVNWILNIIHAECIGLYTELIGWHCLGAESLLIDDFYTLHLLGINHLCQPITKLITMLLDWHSGDI